MLSIISSNLAYSKSRFSHYAANLNFSTVIILNFRTDTCRSGQTVQTQIRLLLEEQTDKGLHCLLFHLHVFDKIPSGLASLYEFSVNYSKGSCVRKFRNFTVHLPLLHVCYSSVCQ